MMWVHNRNQAKVWSFWPNVSKKPGTIMGRQFKSDLQLHFFHLLAVLLATPTFSATALSSTHLLTVYLHTK